MFSRSATAISSAPAPAWKGIQAERALLGAAHAIESAGKVGDAAVAELEQARRRLDGGAEHGPGGQVRRGPDSIGGIGRAGEA